MILDPAHLSHQHRFMFRVYGTAFSSVVMIKDIRDENDLFAAVTYRKHDLRILAEHLLKFQIFKYLLFIDLVPYI